ncbi:cytochrome P450 [Xylariaceae sp. FL1272]|nr:cytochrome P450 [Xylariaceae sp. FL1272]
MPATWIYPVVALLGYAIYRLLQIGSRPKDYPPGPPTVPILGNLHQMPLEDGHVQFKKWAEEYGPVYSLMLGTRCMIVFNSDQAVKDTFDKKSSIYSSRPEVFIARTVGGSHKVDGGYRVLNMPYGDRWRMAHRVYHSILNVRAAKSFVPYQDLENKQMLQGFLDKPEGFIDHLRRYSFSLTTQMIYGFRTPTIDDSRLKALYHNLHQFSKAMGTGVAVFLDFFPWLRVLPDSITKSRGVAKGLHEIELKYHKGNWMDVKRKLKAGTAKPSLCVDLIKAQDAEGFSDEQAGYIAGNLLEAGADTTAAQLTGFVQAMLLYPEVQKKAQAELDRVCGSRMPTMDDWDELPYIRACMKETNRWMPTAILGIAHAVTKDDEYLGYKIPKDAMCVVNVWAIHMDPKRHPNPSAFDPMRYIDDNTTSLESSQQRDVTKRDNFLFGVGRRICQGMHIADRSMFLAISRLLWSFRMETSLDKDGKPIVPDPTKLIQGMLVQPEPYPATIVARTQAHADTIRKEWADACDLLDAEEQWREIPKGMPLSTYEPAAAGELD